MNSIPQTGRSARYVDPPTIPGVPVARGHRHDDLWRSPAEESGSSATDAFPAVYPADALDRDDAPTAQFRAVRRDLDPPTAAVRTAGRDREREDVDRDDWDPGSPDFADDLDGRDFGGPDSDDRDDDGRDYDDGDYAGPDFGGPDLDDGDYDSPDPAGGDLAAGGRTGALVPVASAHRGHGRRGRWGALLLPVTVGIAVSVGLGVYARLHEGTGVALNIAGFSSGIAAKSWLTAAAFALGLVQLGTAVVLSGRIGRGAGHGTHLLHRWSGRIAVLLTIPVAVHCLYALGFSDASLRVLVHSLLGCFFYGAFATKMLLLSRRGAPAWALPVFGGAVFTLLTGVFLTSSVWFFRTKGFVF